MFRRVLSPALVFALVAMGVPLGVTPAAAISTSLVISQFQVAGGTAADEFVELHNVGTTPYDLNGHLLTYRSATGTADSVTTVNVQWTSQTLVPAGGFYLIGAVPGFDGGVASDRTYSDGTTGRLSGSGGGLVLRKGPANTGQVVDSVGYGSATNALVETAATPAPAANASAVRRANGCQDTDNNANDFVALSPAMPRNSATPPLLCVGGDTAPSVSSTSPSAGAGGVSRNANVTVNFSEPVTVEGAWFGISCPSGARTGTTSPASGASSTFTIDPATDFAAGETCTVTIVASQVRDQDTNDPPDTLAADFTWSFTSAATDQCGDPATLISKVQGSGTATTMSGAVTIEGIVVGDYQGVGQFGGYYVQEENADADGDAATSEGIFVSNTSFPVAAGDRVRVTGVAGEASGLTRLSTVSRVLFCPAGGSVTPTTITLPVPSMSAFERYEGMLVRFTQTLTATETFTLGRFGEVRLSANGRLYNPTAITTPGGAAVAQADLNQRSSFILDDGDNRQNIDPTIHPVGGLSASNTLRSGYTVDGLTGVFDFRFSQYRLQPIAPVAFSPGNPRTAAPPAVGGNTKVASFNVLNYFNGDGQGGGFPTARGATTPVELERQRAKEVSALSAMDADIVGLMEIENDAGAYSALGELVAALNDTMGAGTYAYIDTGVIGTDAIKVALIYKPATVTPVGAYQLMTSAVDARFIDTLNRPSLVQTFERNGAGARVTVVVSHLKSKGSDCNAVGDPDRGDGQGNCNGTRTQAAAALADWLATDPTGSGDPRVLFIGDMNAYTFEDPIKTFTNAGYANLVRDYNGLAAYSYVFNGEAGYLDHALASPALAAQATGAVDWHINADEPIVLDYNVEFKTANQVSTFYDAGPYRSSDHDPVVVGLDLKDITKPTITGAATTEPNAAGWYSADVTVHFVCGDNLAVVSCGPDSTLTTDGADQSVTGTARDAAGNTATATVDGINIDKTGPTIAGAATTTANLSGWHASAVTVRFTCADATSGVASCTADQTLSTDGADQSATGTATDLAGNSASRTVSGINIDTTAPTISGAATTSANRYGWYRAAVTIHYTCADALSGIASCGPDSTLAGDGANQSAIGTATDVAGNTTSATVSGINIDRTAPVVAFAGNAGTYSVTQTISITCSAADEISHIDTQTCPTVNAPAYTFSLGSHTLTATATDRAGNTTTVTTTFIVTADATTLCALSREFVTNEGVDRSLCQKLEAAAAAYARGDTTAARNILDAYIHEVNAHRGKRVSDADADILIAIAQTL